MRGTRPVSLRGLRAYAGFKQTGVDYIRPERMFGVTTNSFFKNLDWAKKGILSYTRTPLNMLSFLGITLLGLTGLTVVVQIIVRLAFPESVPSGLTTVLIVMMFFGALNLFAISLIGEYIAKIFDEVKQRPLFIRKSVITNGEVRKAVEASKERAKS